MKYDAQKVREIAKRLGVSEKTVVQYLRCRAALQTGEGDADEISFEGAKPRLHAKRPTQEITPGHLHG